MSRPIMYLDIDDTLIQYRGAGKPAPGAAEFVLWAKTHYDLYWLTMWWPSGIKAPTRVQELSQILGLLPEVIHNIPAAAFWPIQAYHVDDTQNKTNGLHWERLDAGHPWVWVEDSLLRSEREYLKTKRMLHHHIPCDVTANPMRLHKVWRQLQHCRVPKE